MTGREGRKGREVRTHDHWVVAGLERCGGDHISASRCRRGRWS